MKQEHKNYSQGSPLWYIKYSFYVKRIESMHLKINYLYLWNYSKSKEQKHRYNSIFGLSKYAEKAHLRFLPLLVSFHPISRILRLATFSWPIRIFEAWHCLSIISFSRVLGQRRIKIKSELANPNSVENSNGFKWFALISCCTKVRETYQLWNLKFIKIKKKKVMTSFFYNKSLEDVVKGGLFYGPRWKNNFFSPTPHFYRADSEYNVHVRIYIIHPLTCSHLKPRLFCSVFLLAIMLLRLARQTSLCFLFMAFRHGKIKDSISWQNKQSNRISLWLAFEK